MLEVTGLSVRYPASEHPVLAGIDLVVGAGVTAVVGASGSGKTTLLRCIAGAQNSDAGTVRLDGQLIDASNGSGGDRRVGLIFQDYRLVEFLTVMENVRLARELRELPRDDARVSELLQAVGLAGFEGRRLHTLSGGQLQRVGIARALAVEPLLLLADEPTGALDRSNSDVVAELLHALGRTAGIPVLIATHDLRIARTAARVVELPGDGSLIERVTA